MPILLEIRRDVCGLQIILLAKRTLPIAGPYGLDNFVTSPVEIHATTLENSADVLGVSLPW